MKASDKIIQMLPDQFTNRKLLNMRQLDGYEYETMGIDVQLDLSPTHFSLHERKTSNSDSKLTYLQVLSKITLYCVPI